MSDIEQRHMDEAIPEHCMREANQLACVLSANYLNHRQQIATALAAAEQRGREEERWQPIETAPKDGTLVDTWRDGKRHLGCYYRSEGVAGWCQDHGYPRQTRVFLKPPTHWMPLPAPPEAHDVRTTAPRSDAPHRRAGRLPEPFARWTETWLS